MEEKDAPAGWCVWEIPEKTYAVVRCRYDQYEEAYDHVVNEFLPSSGYKMTGALHEVYPPEFKDISEDEFYLYFTIGKR
ncbi:AraC family transcriptional regulator [Candidatus Thorarchaeota archaeon]|nr:MAG: AraC family transcriptional regulator [Candidatus Thorarchaeota archaeon]